MSTIDERVVEMKFDNAQFERNVSQTQGTLDKLKQNLNLDGAAKSVNGLSDAAKGFTLGGLATSAIQPVSAGFVAMATVAITALSNITTAAMATGTQLVRSLTLEPVMAGFAEYELKMGSIQTMLANTNRHGTTLAEVTANLDQLNEYADKTIYNFGDMTRNIGLFTNAGIKIEDATSMIQGFSNSAAASGTSAQGAAGAAYQLSQALSAGTIRLMDWRSLTNVGMGNKNMQTGIIEIAEAMGQFNSETTTAEAAGENFNASLETQWLSADVMSNYLKIMAGDMDAAAMASLGLSEAQVASFQEQQRIAEEAATKVRTWTQLIGTLQEGVGSSWAQTFDILIGDFDQATELFTKISDTLGPMIGRAGEARNQLLQSWVDTGGRDLLISALSSAFDSLLRVLGPIKLAFKEIFPPMLGSDLTNMTLAFQRFVVSLKPTGATMSNIKSIAKGFFAVLDIGWMVIKGVAGVLGDLLGAAVPAGDGILGMAANFGDWLVAVRDAIKQGEFLTTFFSGLGDILKVPIEMFSALTGVLGEMFSGDAANVPDFFDRIGRRLEPLGRIGEHIMNALGGVGTFFADLWNKMQPAINAIGDGLSQLGQWIAEGFQNMDWSLALDGVNTGLLAGLVLLIRNFFNGGGLIDQLKGLFSGGAAAGGGLLDSLKEMFGGVTESLTAMQNNLKAKTLLTLASAIALLAGSMLILALIDPGRLTSATVAMTVMFTQLGVAMYLFEKHIAGGKNIAKMPLLAGAMIILGIAVNIFALAVAKLAGLSWEELAKGLGGLSIILGVLFLFIDNMKSKLPSLIGMGVGIAALAVGIRIMASALEVMGAIPFESLAKGLGSLAAILAMLSAFTKFVNPVKIVSIGFGIAVLGAAMNLFAVAVGKFGAMDWDTIVRGTVGMAGALVAIAIGMNMMPANMLLNAVALVAVGAALLIISNAFKSMGSMSWDEIGRGMVVLAGALGILAIAMYAMSGAALGALALVIVAAGLMLLVPSIQALGMMSWENIGTGLGILAATIGVLAVAGLLLIPASVGFLLLGAAILLIGAGALMTATALTGMATAFTVLIGLAAVGLGALTLTLTAVASLIPMFMEQIGLGIIAFANVIAESGPALVAAITTVLMSFIEAINTIAPEIINTVVTLLLQLLVAIEQIAPQLMQTVTVLVISMTETIIRLVPYLVEAGLRLIVGLLNGIARQIGPIIDAGTNVVLKFMDGIQRNIPKLLNKGADMIISFVNELANTIRTRTDDMNRAGANLADAIIDGMTSGIRNGINTVVNAARRMASNALQAAKDFLGIASPSKEFTKLGAWTSEGMAIGIEKNADMVAKASENVGKTAVTTMKDTLKSISDVAMMDMDMDPTIRPVIDLTKAREAALEMKGMWKRPTLETEGANFEANAIAEGYSSRLLDQQMDKITPIETKIFNFTQNNTSPKALPAAEIYRTTNNQISKIKEELH